jgi:hypothetical protein
MLSIVLWTLTFVIASIKCIMYTAHHLQATSNGKSRAASLVWCSPDRLMFAKFRYWPTLEIFAWLKLDM